VQVNSGSDVSGPHRKTFSEPPALREFKNGRRSNYCVRMGSSAMTVCRVLLVIGVLLTVCTSTTLHERQTVEFFSPTPKGGSMLDNAGPGGGEPLNVIVSALSSPSVLTNRGFTNFARAVDFSTECFGVHLGLQHSANLGDGRGWVNQTLILREDFGDPLLGTCEESLRGGNHFRVYRQYGPNANSGALFLAVSYEKDVTKNHDIIPDGYNYGRDFFVKAAVGRSSFGGLSYNTVARNMTGLLASGNTGVNHGIATDGITTILTITIVS